MLAAMAERLSSACHEQAKAHRTRMHDLVMKDTALKQFTGVLSDFPKVLRLFTLLRIDAVDLPAGIKPWVTREDAEKAQQILELFCEEACEEKAFSHHERRAKSLPRADTASLRRSERRAVSMPRKLRASASRPASDEATEERESSEEHGLRCRPKRRAASRAAALPEMGAGKRRRTLDIVL